MSEENEMNQDHSDIEKVTHVSGMFKNWFIDYASYVILERAVPALEDGLKPVQRRILHSMWELEDGRYNKVANIIGNTMKYHPHGDASISEAIVQLGQKEILIDTQGNWGNILTGDSAAAPRYIEARLSEFAKEVVFSPKITEWALSYDGRNKEPVYLPIKFPLLLAQGVEGIAVGLASKILPHNFNELLDASIQTLKGKKASVYPDFPTGGIADFSDYNDGKRGGKIKIRARLKELNSKTIVITEIPFGTTTGSLIDSIVAANEKGKIKIKKVEDNTAEQVEILVHLQPGVNVDKTIDALYAFTDCEISISPNACVIFNNKPAFLGVSEILKISAERTRDILQRELELELKELQEKWHFMSLEKLFIREEMYIDFKKYSDKDKLYQYLYDRFKPHRKKLLRDISDDDLHKLTQIPMIRITRFDTIKAEELLKETENKIEEVKNHLSNITEYTVEYFKNLKKKYGHLFPRKTESKQLESIDASQVIVANTKLYIDLKEGFIGTGLKKDEFLFECSDLDEIIAFTRSGKMKVVKVAEKVFIGKDIIYAAVFKRNDEKTVYHMIYRDGPKGITFMKKFNVTGVTRDKEYDLTKGTEGSVVYWFSANPNGENEKVIVHLRQVPGLRKTEIEVDFASMEIKGRQAVGNIVTKNTVNKVTLKEKSGGTVQQTHIWFDDATHRLNTEERGTYLGAFSGDDKILAVTSKGYYKLYTYDLINHFDEDLILIEKFYPQNMISCVYYDGESKQYYAKRFLPENTSSKTLIISEHPESHIEIITSQTHPKIQISYAKEKGKELPPETIILESEAPVVGMKAKGKKIGKGKIKEIQLLEPEEIQDAKKFLENFEDDKGLSPVELYKKALEKLNPENARDFLDTGNVGDGQMKLDF